MFDTSVEVDQTVEADPRFSSFLYDEFIARHIRTDVSELGDMLLEWEDEQIGEQQFFRAVNTSPFLKAFTDDNADARDALQIAYEQRDREAYDYIKENYEPDDQFWREDYVDARLEQMPYFGQMNLYAVTPMLGNDLEQLGEMVLSFNAFKIWATEDTPRTNANLQSIITESYDTVLPAAPPTLLSDLDDEIIPEHITQVVAYAGGLEGGEADEVPPYRIPFPSDLEYREVGDEDVEAFTPTEAPAVAIL